MNSADVVGLISIFVGLVGLSFCCFVVVSNKLLKQYYVHWEDWDGNQSYSVVKAYSEDGAARKAYKSNSNACWIGKIVRDTRTR